MWAPTRKIPLSLFVSNTNCQRHDVSHRHPDWLEKGIGEPRMALRRIYQTLPSTKAPLKRATNVRTRRLRRDKKSSPAWDGHMTAA